MNPIDELLEDAKAEVARARKLFPTSPSNPATLALAEEAGELVKAALDHMYLKTPASSEALLSNVRKEAVQTIAMCIRLVTEGDATISLPPSDQA